MKIKNSAGFSLIEVMVTVGVLGILMGAMIQSLLNLRQHEYRVMTLNTRDEALDQLVQGITSNLSIFETTYIVAPTDGGTTLINPVSSGLPNNPTSFPSEITSCYKTIPLTALPSYIQASPNFAAVCLLYGAYPGQPGTSYSGMSLGWSKDIFADVGQTGCKATDLACIGKMGFVIQPMDGFTGLFLATVWVSHSRYNGGQPWVYKFLTGYK